LQKLLTGIFRRGSFFEMPFILGRPNAAIVTFRL
jgi:hypothetical protein